jgi:hypothetical protein
METTNGLLHLRQIKFGAEKIINVPTSFICIIVLFYGAFKYGECAKF